jgi:hypothetical protein
MRSRTSMSDDYQIEIPPSFQALYVDARHRLTLPLADYRARYEFCEDLANHLTAHCHSIHVEIGVDEQDVLRRCLQGLQSGESGVRGDEALWVVTRLAELLGWPPGDLHPAMPVTPG